MQGRGSSTWRLDLAFGVKHAVVEVLLGLAWSIWTLLGLAFDFDCGTGLDRAYFGRGPIY